MTEEELDSMIERLREDNQSLMLDVLYGLEDAPSQDRGRILKYYLINKLEHIESDMLLQLDMIEKAAFIAVNNVQDVRLHSLEAEIRDIKRGEPIRFVDIILELFASIIIEAIFILAIDTIVLPVVVGGLALFIKGVRRMGDSRIDRKLTQRVSTLSPAYQRAIQEAEQVTLRRITSIKDLSSKRNFGDDPLGFGGRYAVRREVDFLNDTRRFIFSEPFRSPGPSNEDLSRTLDKFWGKYAKSRTQRSISSSAYRLLRRGTGSSGEVHSGPNGYTTTAILTDVVQSISKTKRNIKEHYSWLKMMVQVRKDDDILSIQDDNEAIFEVMNEIEEQYADNHFGASTMVNQLHTYVRPMEMATWYIYLKSNGFLEVTSGGQSILAYVTNKKFMDNILVREVVTRSSTTPGLGGGPGQVTYAGSTDSSKRVVGKEYLGLNSLSKYQAYYLYHTFVSSEIGRLEEALTVTGRDPDYGDERFIIIDAQAGKFDTVFGLPDPGSFSLRSVNVEKEDLFKEMKVCVIEFFLLLERELATKSTVGISSSIPEGTSIETILNNIVAPEVNFPRPQSGDVGIPEEVKKVLLDLIEEERETSAMERLQTVFEEYEDARYNYVLWNGLEISDDLPEAYRASHQTHKEELIILLKRKAERLRLEVDHLRSAYVYDDSRVSEALDTVEREMSNERLSDDDFFFFNPFGSDDVPLNFSNSDDY